MVVPHSDLIFMMKCGVIFKGLRRISADESLEPKLESAPPQLETWGQHRLDRRRKFVACFECGCCKDDPNEHFSPELAAAMAGDVRRHATHIVRYRYLLPTGPLPYILALHSGASERRSLDLT